MAKKRGNNTLIIILVILIAALVGFVIWKNRNQPKGEKVFTEEVQRRTIREQVAASGKVFPQTEVKISSDVSGEIVELPVEEGDSVVTGQLLAKIDPDAYQSQVERGEAQVNSAKAQLSNAMSQIKQFQAQKEQIDAQLINAREIFERNKQLKEEGVISDVEYEQSLSNLRALEANLRAADANINAAEESAESARFQVASAVAALKEMQTSLHRTTIYAPMTGIISRLNVEEGERVVGTIQMTGTEMMRIANLNNMEVRVEVSENDIPRVSLGDEVEIEVDAYLDRKFKGKVTQIANSAIAEATATATLTSEQVTNFEVRINIDPASYADLISDNPYPFRPGMSASVEINTKTVTDALSIPIQSVTTREKGELKDILNVEEMEKDELVEIVFQVMPADTVRVVPVETGVQDDDYIHVTSGLQEGDVIVAGPYSAIARELKNGTEIQRVDRDEFYGTAEEE
jgi:HlyD family secretion protein